MNTHTAGPNDQVAADTLDPTTYETSRAQRERSMHRSTRAGLAGIVAIGMCLSLTAVASARPAPTTTSQASNTIATNDPAANLPAWPRLHKGTNISWPAVTVRSLQHLLNAHGAALVVDGIFGVRTDAAVRAFQRTNGLAVDGIVGEKTWSALIITVQRGSVGAAVKVVQDQSSSRHLTPDGSELLEIDGVFGPRTEEWVRDFQTTLATNVPTPVDGIVGIVTWHALISGVFAE